MQLEDATESPHCYSVAAECKRIATELGQACCEVDRPLIIASLK